ncbi:uncharacterized protein JCM6883_002315 [Sporobolomyces salmoneus]|uniref:uncharacterized protein n=1 Tax=Sporobolomyces salmoneus TaxID=183962 RepID=UPI00316BCD00
MSLFGNQTSSAPTFSFGQPSTSSAPTTSAPSLFGSTPASAPASGGLFGAAKPNTPVGGGGGGGGLFGSTTSSAPATGTTGGTSLFSGLGGGGNTGTAGAGAGQTKPTFSFGTPSAGTSAPPATGSLFGGTSTVPATGGLFGQPQAQPAAGGAGGGLFGSTTTSAAPNMFGMSQNTQQQQQQPQQQQNQFGQSTTTNTGAGSSGINKQTKFQELPDQARNLVEEMDKFIRSQGQLADDLKGKNLGSEITQTSRMFDQYSAEATTVTSLLENDSRLIASLRQDLEQSLSDLTKTTTLIEGFKGGSNSQKASEAKGVAGFPYEFFRRKSTELGERLERYRQTIDQISSVLLSPQSSLSPASILPTLKAQHASLISLASSVSSLELELKGLKDDYRGIWREKTGRLVDPFRLGGGGQGVKGVESGVRGMEIR